MISSDYTQGKRKSITGRCESEAELKAEDGDFGFLDEIIRKIFIEGESLARDFLNKIKGYNISRW